jgi:nitrate reductase NapAB chaperone NapD
MARPIGIISKFSRLDRRELLAGNWMAGGGTVARQRIGLGDVVTILIQVWPERLAEVEQELASIGALKINRGHTNARLRVVITLTEAVDLAGALDAITAIPGVLVATLPSTGFSEAGA